MKKNIVSIAKELQSATSEYDVWSARRTKAELVFRSAKVGHLKAFLRLRASRKAMDDLLAETNAEDI